MKKQITPEQKSAIKEGLIVFAWAGLSAVFPMIMAWMEKDVRWAALAPILNAIFYSLKTAYQNRTK